MGISTYQVQNILHIYNKQLKFRNLASHKDKTQDQLPMDEVQISDEAKKKQIIKQARSQVMDQVMKKAFDDDEISNNKNSTNDNK